MTSGSGPPESRNGPGPAEGLGRVAPPAGTRFAAKSLEAAVEPGNVLLDAGQRHVERSGELADRGIGAAEAGPRADPLCPSIST